ncbi:MAG: hypothetical protein HONBIEJF_00824 [Fimbriimonadaceae bacterium]|nr:hypothetical protein [Fimbriimonadaceae bacterium]
MRFWSVVILLAGALSALAEPPKVLVVQSLAPAGRDVDPNVRVAHHLAEALDTDGRIVPIVWSQSDPLFRKLLDDNQIGVVPEDPTPNEAYLFGKKLKFRYVLVVSAITEAGDLLASGALYENNPNKPVWSENRSSGVMTNGAFDPENSARTLARSWTIALGAGPFKRFPPKVSGPTTAVETPKPAADPISPSYDARDLQKVDEWIKAGETTLAAALLRDMIDFDPKNLQLREKLLNALLLDYPASAAEIATQLADREPDKPDFRLLAAESFLRSGKLQDAGRELELVKQRNGNDPRYLRLAGDFASAKGEWLEARQHYDRCLEAGPNPQARRNRGLARVMLGDANGAKEDFGYEVLTGRFMEDFYKRAVSLADLAVPGLADEIRTTLQRLRVNRDDPSVREATNSMLARSSSLAEMLKGIAVPEFHQNSHQWRALACSLLVQASQDLVKLAKEGDDEAGAECAISLGEGLKNWAKATEAYAKENRPIK